MNEDLDDIDHHKRSPCHPASHLDDGTTLQGQGTKMVDPDDCWIP
jgi:hypothetical protein